MFSSRLLSAASRCPEVLAGRVHGALALKIADV